MTSELGSPIDLIRPAGAEAPVILSSPHSGQLYPPSVLRGTRLHPNQLRRLEDAFVDQLFDMAPALGAPLLRARFARAFVDVNREAFEIDADLLNEPLPDYANGQSAKARAGLGTVPSRISGQPIYRSRLSLEEIERRVASAYWPYHHTLKALIDAGRERFGQVLLLDCHSMPSFNANGALSDHATGRKSGAGSGMIDIALGDRFGSSCSPRIMRSAEAHLQRAGLRVIRNRPYAGGHITAHYGQPSSGVHTLQIEIRRGLYMDEGTHRLHEQLGALKGVLGGLVGGLIDLMNEMGSAASAHTLAAE